MVETLHDKSFAGGPAANYQRYFVPTIGAPLAATLVKVADPQLGERVLDVACGTGVLTRLEAERVGWTGMVRGLDVNPSMLAVAKTVPVAGAPIDWHEGSAERLPFPDNIFDLVTCQLGLQFFQEKITALREQRRVLRRGGRVALNVPGPIPTLYESFAKVLRRRVGPEAAGFVQTVFSVHDTDEIRSMMAVAGFQAVHVDAEKMTFHLPAPADFMWQYIYSTPIAAMIEPLDAEQREALEGEVCDTWRAADRNGGLSEEVRIITVTARA